ncbi:stalk domain-containing protein [Desulforamulus aeronauticus]|uniref:Mannosyl-glycoprotein endo-beta-N-acetylglucosaminidase n=1 Tax=Desulforamulus aeronauticus DSM 10349 TaxID=1121421 RepID=A0A1M6P4N4_9FIRM|nr:stalk domain-containing protein [Desulforamulus aeronauticus]SHK02870.1 Mannosyl-glycoprotein endo-beta-N-acetylglucosaminidase [Desulforamulus aeronauticus DSM 10349]
MIEIRYLSKIKKSLALLLCSSLLCVGPLPSLAATNYQANIVIDNTPVVIPAGDQPAVIKNNRTFVPLRIISENLGAQVDWLNQTKQVIITTPRGKATTIPQRDKATDVQIVVDGQIIPVSQDGLPFISAGRTMVPLRLVGEALGCYVEWQQTGRTVNITSQPEQPEPEPEIPTVPTTPENPEQPQIPETPAPEPAPIDMALLQELAEHKTNLRLLDKSIINSQDLLTMNAAIFTPEQMNLLKTYRDQLSKYPDRITLPNGTVVTLAEWSIFGESVATAEQLKAWLDEKVRNEERLGRQVIPVPDVAELYLKIGAEYGIRGDLAFAQAAKETRYWQFTGDVQPWQNNYCGLWATGAALTGQESFNGADPSFVCFEAGVHGAIFATPEAGVEAHIQHLYAYATKKPLPQGKVLVDPRYSLVSGGVSPTWLKLNARWAVPGTTYGQSIIYDYWLPALQK